MKSCLLLSLVLLTACTRAPEPAADPALLSEIQQIKAIDNHAHPVRVTAAGEPEDRDFDALPVDNMEPQSDPLNLRPNPANKDLFGGPDGKKRLQQQHGNDYPSWVLDQAGIEIMFANRVAMGASIAPPRFRWVPYVDALIFPLDNTALAAQNPDRKAFFALEDKLRARYLKDSGLERPPATLADYLARVVTPTLERQRQGGAIAEKFEAAYLRTLAFDPVDRATADRLYQRFLGNPGPAQPEYKPLQDFLFRYIAVECGRLGMAVHLHTMAGAGGYFDIGGDNPLHLESVLNDPSLRKTKFVMLHGGWPFIHEITSLLVKPNAYLDFSQQDLQQTPANLAANIREWLEYVPEKVLFGTDAYPYIPELGWEESAVVASRNARQALAIALTHMMRDGEITRARAAELARMVLHDNAKALYGL